MFREMRRKKQLLEEAQSIDILEKGTSGVLALLGDEDYPYAVPISYMYDEGKIYFHGAKAGHKIDAIKKCSKASFCVIDQDHIVPEKYTTYFRSVIAFGRLRIMENEEEIRTAIEKLAKKYHPNDSETSRNQAIQREWKPLCMIEMTIEHMTGKEAIELVKKPEQTINVSGKPKVAFVCVHNSCRSQIAEALGKKLASDVFESYSAGTELKDHINPDAVRMMKKLHGIDMEQEQYNKLITDIPKPDVVIFMGCNVSCPNLSSQYAENWGLDDPTGQSDEVFAETIREIEEKVLRLKDRLDIIKSHEKN